MPCHYSPLWLESKVGVAERLLKVVVAFKSRFGHAKQSTLILHVTCVTPWSCPGRLCLKDEGGNYYCKARHLGIKCTPNEAALLVLWPNG